LKIKSLTLVFGASLKPERISNLTIKRLNGHGYEVVAFGLIEGEIDGITIDTDLKMYESVDTITLYLNAKRQKEYYNYLIALKPNRIIFNPGTENPEFYALLKENNIKFEVACTLVLLSTYQY
jgi:predicted CoA-binding protein